MKPVCAEITYGLERICMYLQNVETFVDLKWNKDLSYADVHLQGEIEFSHYNFDEADTALLFRHFDEFEAEGMRLLDRGLILPGFDFCLKCAHCFNVLDARGAISVTERQKFIGRVRRMAKKAAESYVDKRASMGFPMLRDPIRRAELALGGAQ